MCPSLMGSWGRCQALLWAGMLAPSWHGLVTSVPQHQAELPPGPAGTSQLDRGAEAARAWPWPSHLDAVPGTSSVGLFLWLQMCFVGSPLAELFVFCSSSAGPIKGCSCLQLQGRPEPLSPFLSHCSWSPSEGWWLAPCYACRESHPGPSLPHTAGSVVTVCASLGLSESTACSAVSVQHGVIVGTEHSKSGTFNWTICVM